ncbi:tRNA methyltransferase, putative [Plasmodium gallinaceum]|uniref:tRNA methyltransferase, putative n=1 Tax=Plasmodium gallinaceum TaxID=5849 RepID=A0A1J1GXB2_PLAGA|nr:tRNA methyltransferase, putative [Plasmodium gallinaceum]CRG97211.1 tRNA methyltransferase, putative [Plasmodium gallinaceum]
MFIVLIYFILCLSFSDNKIIRNEKIGVNGYINNVKINTINWSKKLYNNKNFKRNIRIIYEDLKSLNERENKINYLIKRNIETCKNNYFPLIKKKFTNKDISDFTKEKKQFFINKVRKNVFYKYVYNCNSSVYLAIDIIRKIKKQNEKLKRDKCFPNLELNNEKKYVNNKRKKTTLNILKRKDDIDDIIKYNLKKRKYLITIDGFSDNLLLCCFLHSLLKGLQQVNLNFFLKMDIKQIANHLKNLFTIHFNIEHIINYIYEYIKNFILKEDIKNNKRKIKNKEKVSFKLNESMLDSKNSIEDKKIILNPDENSMKIYPYPRVAHMLSGGIDSLMALFLLEKKKYYIDNFFFNFNNYNCSKNDLKYVKRICKKRRNLYIININDEYFKRVLVPMLKNYSKGEIPNPDIICNKKIKYSFFLKIIKSLYKKKNNVFNYSYISTGHYAMISTNDTHNANNFFNNNFPYLYEKNEKEHIGKKKYKLLVSSDRKKDQTFFLSSFSENQLSKFIFPLCLHTKENIKNFMKKENIDYYNKNETKGLCLYGNVNMHLLLKAYLKNDKDIKNENISEKSSSELNTNDLLTFKEKYISSFNLNYINYIISIDDEIVIDKNYDIHFYAIGQNKYITNFIHSLYNKRIKKNCKNLFSSCQWIVAYKKMIENKDKNLRENFIYVTKKYKDDLFKNIRTKCKLKNIKWIEGKVPICLKKQKRSKDEKIIFVKIRNNENIKRAKIKFLLNNTAYLKLQKEDIGLSPGQIISFYFPFILKNRKIKYIYSLNKYQSNLIYYQCIGSSKISNQFLDFKLYQKILNIHKNNSLIIF